MPLPRYLQDKFSSLSFSSPVLAGWRCLSLQEPLGAGVRGAAREVTHPPRSAGTDLIPNESRSFGARAARPSVCVRAAREWWGSGGEERCPGLRQAGCSGAGPQKSVSRCSLFLAGVQRFRGLAPEAG